MQKLLLTVMLSLFVISDARSEEPAGDVAGPAEKQGDEPTNPAEPKTMSGMSILGNEEAPKALVIVPWKSSELGADISLSDSLDDRARPVDKEVFMRELNFYDIRASD
jgi:hypothetical protein